MPAITSAPVLSTPANSDSFAVHPVAEATATRPRLGDSALREQYEIARTADEICAAGWTSTVALQFPDDMLCDAGQVVDALAGELKRRESGNMNGPKLYVLADTSYSPCCVDEVAAEHVGAQAVVHYGRACLSATARLPTVHVFTRRELDPEAAVAAFARVAGGKDDKVVVAADVLFQSHVDGVVERLRAAGYENVVGTRVVRDPTGRLPNREVVAAAAAVNDEPDLACYALFHIGVPPTALLLALSSRFRTFHIHSPLLLPADSDSDSDVPTASSTAALLRRRFARVLAASTAGIIGILVNTLSVANYLSSLATIRAKIAASGKKSYTVVVGKVNPTKLANFQEIEAWVVVGCWEGGLVDGEGFWRPVVTPFELEVALQDEDERVWTGEWWGGIEGVDGWDIRPKERRDNAGGDGDGGGGGGGGDDDDGDDDGVQGEESEPPEYDWRTGRLVSHSHSRPMRHASARDESRQERSGGGADQSLIRRALGEIATINGAASPGAEFLRSQRTWQGLGTDFDGEETSTVIEEGRSGIARGYVAGGETERR